MASNFTKFYNGIRLVPQGTNVPTLPGEVRYNNSSGKMELVDANGRSPVVTESGGASLSNKIINGDTNTIVNLKVSQFASGQTPALADLSNVNATDVTAKALTGFSASPSTAVTASDSILSALGKLQAQINTASSTSTRSIQAVSSSQTMGSAAKTDYVYLASNTITLTLPTAVGNTNVYSIKNIGTGTVTVNTTSSQTIDGGLSAVLSVRYVSIDLVSDGSNWYVV